MPTPLFVLLHSPLVGPLTWSLVAAELKVQGYQVVLPELRNSETSGTPYREQHAQAVTAALPADACQRAIILVGHSGAGPLLPLLRQAIGCPVAAYLFVDAGLPLDGKSRLDLFEDAQAAGEFRRAAAGGYIPAWTAEDLQEVIPDERLRARFAAELAPTPLGVYEEALPVFEGWPDAPCGYLRFGDNPAYQAAGQRAITAGFVCARIEGQHFHMLVEPGVVAQAMLELVGQMGLRLE